MSETNTVERPVRAQHPERGAFEQWKATVGGGHYMSRNNTPGSDPDGYQDPYTQGQWEAWKAARPNRAAYGAAINVAAALAQRKPLAAFGALEDCTHIGHRQFSRAYEQADELTQKD